MNQTLVVYVVEREAQHNINSFEHRVDYLHVHVCYTEYKQKQGRLDERIMNTCVVETIFLFTSINE